MGSTTGRIVDWLRNDSGGIDTIHVSIQGDDSSLFECGISVGDSLRIVQCNGEEKETDVFEQMRELQSEAEYALDAMWAVTTWYAGGYWCAREMKNDDTRFEGRGPTPIAALEDLLARVKEQQAPNPHEEEWTIEQCIEWLEERGEISTGATLRTAYLWEKESFQDGGRLIAKAHSHFSWTRAYRNLVVEAWEALSEGN